MALETMLTLAAVKDGSATIEQYKSAIPPSKDVDLNRKFVDGDHWQSGDGWVGPGPVKSDPEYRTIMAVIEAAFVSRNVIDEAIDRLVSAIMGKEPRWSWVPDRPMDDDEEPTTEEQTLIAEIEDAMTQWWNKRQAHLLLKEMIYKMCFGRRGVWRLFVPMGIADSTQNVSADEFKDALLKLYLDIPEPETSGVWEDPDTRELVGIVIWKDAKDVEQCEVTWLEGEKTMIRILPDQPTPVPNEYSGAMPVFEAHLTYEFVNAQLRSLQRALNMTLTLISKGLIDNAFLERIMLGVLPPGHWEYEDKPDENGNKIRKAYVPDRHETGGRITTYAQPVDFTDEKGVTQLTTPSVVFRDPTDPSGIIKGADFWYSAMLDEVRQAHVLLSKSVVASGKSREQARGDFIDSTNDPQAQTEGAGLELLLCLAKMGEAVCNKRGIYTGKLRPVFKCRPNYGPLTVEERLQNVNEAKDGYMADATAMALNGIDDTDAEMALIEGQPRAAIALSKLQAEAVKAWVDAGFTFEVALVMIGKDEEEIKKIMKRNEDTTVPIDPTTQNPDGSPKPPVAIVPPPGSIGTQKPPKPAPAKRGAGNGA